MAAIAQISSLREWEEEWNVLEEETQNFKQTKFQDYQQKMDEFHAIQKSCVSGVNQQKRKLADFRQSLKQFMKGRLTDEQKAHSHQLQLKMTDLERKIKAFEISLPSQAGLFLKCCLGNINVSLHNKKLEYKNDYENFKFKMILISMLFTILDLFVFNYRYAHEIKKLLCLLTTLYIYVHVLRIVLGFPVSLILLKKYLSNKELNLLCRITDALFHALLLWYYSTLTLQEHILIANGSRIKGWWVAHHYVSILLSGLLLIWPDGTVYQLFRKQFFYFSLYLAFVQLLQFRYQSGVLYRLRALGISHSMDITKEGFQSWMWRGLGFVIPFLIVGYVFQLYNAYTLYRLSFHAECTDWQVLALSVVFFTLFAGNMTTLLYVLQQKITKTWRVPEMPCG